MKRFAPILFFALMTAIAVALPLAAADSAGKGFPVRAASASPAAAQPRYAPAAASTPAVEAAPVSSQEYENQPITFAGPRRSPSQTGEGRQFVMPSIWPALLAVVVVCGLFCAILYVAKRYLPGHRQMFSHPAMEVLGRTHLDQRRYVSLIRVGKRIVVVGVSPDEMRALSEITDEEEITGILEVARPKTEAGLTIFQRLFQRTVAKADADEARAMAEEKTKQLKAQMSNLRQRVAEIKRPPEAKAGEEADKRQRVDALG